jgi:hypothetical protein
MKLRKIFLFLLTSILSLQICLGQDIEDIQPEKNWLANYGIYPTEFLYHCYDRYSKEDIAKLREKLDLMKDAKSSDEWDGVYFIGSEETVNHLELHINSNTGFIYFNVYTCLPELRNINYGRIVETADFIQLSPEFAPNSPRKSEPVKYVKVKWGDKFLLVEESALPFFTEKAVGIYVEPEDDSSEDRFKWTDFWVKGDSNSVNHNQVENEYVGLPQFPASYRKFQRFPIEAKIISVGNRTVGKADVAGNESGDFMEAVYKVMIGAGKNKGVKTGMTFDVPEIGEEFVIKQVNQNNAIGEIVRSLDENKNDFCIDDNSNQITCPKIKSSMKVKTKIGYFFF